VCRQCGLIRDFYSKAFDELKFSQSLREMSSIETTHVEVRGLCHTCANKQEATSERRRS
jgi:Fur family peroxide stress response transcriptional regulator